MLLVIGSVVCSAACLSFAYESVSLHKQTQVQISSIDSCFFQSRSHRANVFFRLTMPLSAFHVLSSLTGC